jgi:hypothetical protein
VDKGGTKRDLRTLSCRPTRMALVIFQAERHAHEERLLLTSDTGDRYPPCGISNHPKRAADWIHTITSNSVLNFAKSPAISNTITNIISLCASL